MKKMKKTLYLSIAGLCLLSFLSVVYAQEKILFSVSGYTSSANPTPNGLYYLDKDGSNGPDLATDFAPRDIFGEYTGHFIQSKDGEIVGINDYGGPHEPDTEGYGTLYRITPKGVVMVQNYSYGEAPHYIAEGTNVGQLYGTGYKPVQYAQILEGTKYDGLTGSIIYKYGFQPREILAARDGNVYGTASIGGANNQGYIFKFNGGSIQVLYSFSKPTGHYALGKVVMGQDGYLYGTTKRGGLRDYGVIYKVKPDGSGYQVLHHFDKVNGMYPDRGLVQDANGRLYGMTPVGGQTNLGVIFSIHHDGSGFKKLHDISIAKQYGTPVQSLLLDTEGYLYGLLPRATGTLFRIKTDGTGFKVILNSELNIQTLQLVNSVTPEYKLRDPVDGATNVTTTYIFVGDSVPGTKTYSLELSLNPEFNPIQSYTFSHSHKIKLGVLNPGTKYYARFSSSLWPKPGGVTSFTTTSSLLYSTVTTPYDGAENIAVPTFTVTVKAVTGASLYTVELNTSPYFDRPSIVATTTNDKRTFKMSGVAYNTKYYARVKTDVSEGYGRIISFTTMQQSTSTTASTFHVNVYPNPTSDQFTISAPEQSDEEMEVEISDFTGTTVGRSRLKDGQLTTGETLPKGVYVLKVYRGKSVTQQRLIKN
jgi:uncharacterized repeat protein (TIGR03803 family)